MKEIIQKMIIMLCQSFDKNAEAYRNEFAARDKCMNALGAMHMILLVGQDEGMSDKDLDPFVAEYTVRLNTLNAIDGLWAIKYSENEGENENV